MQRMNDAEYKVTANNLIEELLQPYSKSRSFIDELKKIL